MAIDIGAQATKLGLEAKPIDQQWNSALILAYVLIGCGVALSIILGVLSFNANIPAPVAPAISPAPDATAIKTYNDLITAYKVLSDQQLTRFTSLFQLVVISAILPLVTAVFGYLFGKSKV